MQVCKRADIVRQCRHQKAEIMCKNRNNDLLDTKQLRQNGPELKRNRKTVYLKMIETSTSAKIIQYSHFNVKKRPNGFSGKGYRAEKQRMNKKFSCLF